MGSDDQVKKEGAVTLIQCFPTNRCKPEDHDFPASEQGEITDDARCVKCGMSFLAYVHMDMP